MSEDIVYVSNVRIERIKGPYRLARLPVEAQPIAFGVHSQIAEHYDTDLNIHEPHATTLDYLVASAGG